MSSIGEDAVVVGHSAGGLTIPIVAALRPVAQLIFISALLPMPGLSANNQFAAEPDMALKGFRWVERGDGLLDMPEDVALEYFFHDCPADKARAAVTRLRPQTDRTLVEVTPLIVWPDTPRGAITCAHDRILGPEWQLRTARSRLGVDPIILNCGHSPAMACPDDLADAVEQLARR
jgi:pimeloyl-ACP methyl ester carboxylesterase